MDGPASPPKIDHAALRRRLWRRFVDFLTPPKCLSCRGAVGDGATLCAFCWQKLNFIEAPICDVLGTPFPYDPGPGAISPAAMAEPPRWDRARAAVAYDEHSRKLVHALKYADRMEAGIFMAQQMARGGRALLADTDMMVPVPLHRWRLWQRRFNQAAFLAQELSKLTGRPAALDVLTRTMYTRSQVGLKAGERRKNMARVFAVPPEAAAALAGRKVTLVDDVMTTGATAASCADALKKAGAAEVDVLTFALVLEPKRPHIA
jgi:ComF family protein